MKRSLLRAVLDARADKRPLVLVTELGTGRQWAEIEGEPVLRGGADAGIRERSPDSGIKGEPVLRGGADARIHERSPDSGIEGEPVLRGSADAGIRERSPDSGIEGEPTPGGGADISEAARDALRRDRSEVVELAGVRYFLHVMSPPLRLFVVGAVHITQALVPMASLLGYAVTVIDPRRAFGDGERFPGVAVVTDWPDDALHAANLDARSAVVTLTHDPKLDDPALRVALASPAFYIGSLGSRRTHAKRVARLADAGMTDTALARIHAPVGLDIGAVTAAEIAASIVAELTAGFRGRSKT